MTYNYAPTDFEVGEVVQHLFHARYFTIDKVGRSLIHCHLNTDDAPKPRKFAFRPTSLRKLP